MDGYGALTFDPTSRPNGRVAARRRETGWLNYRASVSPDFPEIEEMRVASAATDAYLNSFRPRRGLTNGHLQTIVGNFYPRPPFTCLSTAETVVVDAIDGSRVLCHCDWQPEAVRASRLTVLLVHGLEGSSDSRYIKGIAGRAWKSGCNVIRMNMRNCGDTDTLTPTLYHSGLSGDVGAVVRHYCDLYGLERVALVGYSMGGNLVLKLAGEWGSLPPLLTVAAVCPAIDLGAGSDALHERQNRVYEWRFLRGLMRRFRRKAALFPAIYETRNVGPVRSLREFDDKIVARYCGFRDADDYYYRVASARVVDRIVVPTLILQAMDDPFVRLTSETRAKLHANPHVTLIETRHGGHCAYLSRDRGDDIHWAEAAAMRYILRVSGARQALHHANGS
jgi:predicted alpha/beta-fold hydrolase